MKGGNQPRRGISEKHEIATITISVPQGPSYLHWNASTVAKTTTTTTHLHVFLIKICYFQNILLPINAWPINWLDLTYYLGYVWRAKMSQVKSLRGTPSVTCCFYLFFFVFFYLLTVYISWCLAREHEISRGKMLTKEKDLPRLVASVTKRHNRAGRRRWSCCTSFTFTSLRNNNMSGVRGERDPADGSGHLQL